MRYAGVEVAPPVAAAGVDDFLVAPSRLLAITTLSHLVTTPRLLDGSHPNRSFDSLDGGGSVVVPQEEGHGDRSGQVLNFVLIDGEDDPLLSEGSYFLSLPPQSSLGGPGDDDCVVASSHLWMEARDRSCSDHETTNHHLVISWSHGEFSL